MGPHKTAVIIIDVACNSGQHLKDYVKGLNLWTNQPYFLYPLGHIRHDYANVV